MEEQLIVVRKLAYDRRETWRWTGKLVGHEDGVRVVDALFNGKPRDLGYMTLDTSDLFHEFYYADRWFNVFQVTGGDGVLKGWYCNVTTPAIFSNEEISFVDMVLDVFVYPDGRTLVLDEEDFQKNRESVYSPEDAARAEKAVQELLDMVARREHPFDAISPASP